MSHHIALLGDSIFDNAAYTGGEPDVAGHLRAILPAPWRATLCAVDGSAAADLARQLGTVPVDASHLVVAVGGNDALDEIDMLDLPVTSTAQALALFGRRIHAFEARYRNALEAVLARGLPTSVCTIYNGDLPPEQAPLARVALMLFDDTILRVAFEHRLSVLELRLVCDEKADYANPIEPSGRGGRKIAGAVARMVGAVGDGACSRVFGR